MIRILREQGESMSLLLEPNHSLPPQIHAMLVGVALFLTTGASLLFIVIGAWLVVPFILLEAVFLVGVLYLVQSRCQASERLLIGRRWVSVQKLHGQNRRVWRFNRDHLSILLGADESQLICHITLCGDGGLLEIGDFLNQDDMKLLVRQLSQRGLRSHKHCDWALLAC